LRVITCDEHVISIEKKSATTRRGVNKESRVRVMVTGLEANISYNRGEALKLSPRSLFETIKRTTQPANHATRGGGCMYTSQSSPWRKAFLTYSLEMDHWRTEATTRSLNGGCEPLEQRSHHSHVTTLHLLQTLSHKTSLIALK
jgi:hypothetical protein